MKAPNYRRPPFPARPWITGQLWDKYASTSILHCDAYLETNGEIRALRLEWREGGQKLMARDVYRIEHDGLTEVDAHTWLFHRRILEYWTRENNAIMARVHVTVLELTRSALWARYGRVSLQAHYVYLNESDPFEGVENAYREKSVYPSRAPFTPEQRETLQARAAHMRAVKKAKRLEASGESVRVVQPWEVWTPGAPIPRDVL